MVALDFGDQRERRGETEPEKLDVIGGDGADARAEGHFDRVPSVSQVW